jgi:hypothetical protein
LLLCHNKNIGQRLSITVDDNNDAVLQVFNDNVNDHDNDVHGDNDDDDDGDDGDDNKLTMMVLTYTQSLRTNNLIYSCIFVVNL